MSRTQRQPRSAGGWAVAVATLLLGLLATAATAAVVRISAGPSSEIIIETNDPQIEVVVQNERIIRIVDLVTGKTYQVDRETLDLAQADDRHGLLVTLAGQREIVLRRQGRKIAAVRLERKPVLAGAEWAEIRKAARSPAGTFSAPVASNKFVFASGRTQVRFAQPAGMQVAWSASDSDGIERQAKNPLKVPGRYNFAQAAIYRLQLSHIAGHPGLEVYPTLEVVPANPKTAEYLHHNAVPVQFTPDDFRQIMAGNHVVKVIYLPDPKNRNSVRSGPEEIISTQLEPGVDPIAEARRRGSILLVVRMGNVDQDAHLNPAPVPGTRTARTPVQVQLDLLVAALQGPAFRQLGFAALSERANKLVKVLDTHERLTREIEKLRTEGRLKILAAPRMVTVSGRPATFLSGGQVPLAAAGSADTGIRTVSFQPFGLQVQCLPAVLSRGQIHLELEVSADRITPPKDTTVDAKVVSLLEQQPCHTAVTLVSGKTLALVTAIQQRGGGTEPAQKLLILITPRLIESQVDQESPR